MPGGCVVREANGQALVYLYSRDNEAEALQAKVLTAHEARRIAVDRRCRRWLPMIRPPAIRTANRAQWRPR
jgi:hypothetical protein